MKCPQKVSFLCLTFWGQYIFGRLFFFVYLEFLVEKCKYNIKDRKKNFFVVKVMEARELASITGKIRDQGSNFSQETRRGYWRPHNQKIFFFLSFITFKNINFRFCTINYSLNIRTVSINDKDICK